MFWKQPITTECLKMDTATRLIFMEIMIHCRNEDMEFPEFIQHGNKRIAYQLKRGQSLFFSKNFKEIGLTRTTVERSLKMLLNKNSTINMTINRQPFGLIISVLNYDELTKMTFNNEIKQQSNNNQTTIKQHANNKSDKNDTYNIDKKVEIDVFLEKIKELKSNPVFEKQKDLAFPVLTENQIDSCLLSAVMSKPDISFLSALNWLKNENASAIKAGAKVKNDDNLNNLPKIISQKELMNS